jgi:pyruvate/2-oxoglutarate/acetoin dehydrogenase E1 component
VDEANPRCSLAADISAMLCERCFGALKGPIRMITAPHTPVPYAPSLEDAYIPSPDRVVDAAQTLLKSL